MGLILNPYRYAAGSTFDPISALTWQHAYWPEGSAFEAEGYVDDSTVVLWPDEVASLDLESGSPKFRAAETSLNSQPAVDYHLSSADLTTSSTTSVSQAFTIVVIMRFDLDPPNIEYIYDEITSGGSRVFLLVRGGSGDDYVMGSGASSIVGGDITGLDTNPVGFRAYYNGASSSLHVNGSSVLSGNAGTSSFTDMRLGGSRADGNLVDGKFAFWGIASGDVTGQSNWSDFVSWASTHYGASI